MAEGEQGRDQRQAERRVFINFVWYHCIPTDETQGTPIEHGIARSCDLSQSGCGIVVPDRLEPGRRVFLEILSSGGSLSLVGRVMYCREQDGGFFRVGIRIELIPPTDLTALSRLVEP